MYAVHINETFKAGLESLAERRNVCGKRNELGLAVAETRRRLGAEAIVSLGFDGPVYSGFPTASAQPATARPARAPKVDLEFTKDEYETYGSLAFFCGPAGLPEPGLPAIN